MSILAYTILFFSVIIFYVLLLWFFHKASVHFRRMDERVGNTDEAQNVSTYNDCIIIVKKGEEEKEEGGNKIKEQQEIY